MRKLHILWLTFALGALVPPASAGPRDELLRHVPDDMMFCAVLQDLREHARRLEKDDSFLAAIKRMPFARAQIDSPEFKKLLDFYRVIVKELNITPEQLRDDLLGDAVVFAYRQDKSGKPEQEQALLLVYARDARLLRAVIERINDLQKKTGELKELKEIKHPKGNYIERLKIRDGNPAESEFYFIRDHLLVFSQRESLLKDVIARDPATADSLWSRMSKKLGIDKALLALLVNPRAFDGELDSRQMTAAGGEKAFLKEFRNYWKSFEGVAVFGNAGTDLELGIAIDARRKDLPPAGQKFLAELGKPSSLWNVIPDDCLLALSARFNLALFTDALFGFVEPERSKEARKWLADTLQPFLPDGGDVESMLKGLGPDWGFWMMPPEEGAKAWTPRAILAVAISPSPEGAVAETTARNAVQFLFTAARLSKDEFKVETVKIDKTTIRCISHPTMFPPGFRPSFAVKDGYLLLASSPELIGRFQKPAEQGGLPSETPLLRISAKAWRAYLTQHRSGIAAFLEKANGAPAKDIVEILDRIAANLEPFERFEIGLRTEKDVATVLLRIKTAKSK